MNDFFILKDIAEYLRNIINSFNITNIKKWLKICLPLKIYNPKIFLFRKVNLPKKLRLLHIETSDI